MKGLTNHSVNYSEYNYPSRKTAFPFVLTEEKEVHKSELFFSPWILFQCGAKVG